MISINYLLLSSTWSIDLKYNLNFFFHYSNYCNNSKCKQLKSKYLFDN